MYVLLKFVFLVFLRYEEAREEEKLRSQREDFSDMVAEVCCSILQISVSKLDMKYKFNKPIFGT